MSPQNGPLCSTYFFFQRSLAKRYVFHCFSAGLPEIINFSNGFQQFLLKADFFDFAPFRSLHESYAFAHMLICCGKKHHIFPMHFNNFAFRCYVGLKNRAVTNGFGHFFKATSILHHHQGSLSSLEITLFQF